MTESELNGIGERLRQHAPATDAEHFMAAEISLLLIEVARLRDENAQLRPLLDKLQDSDLAVEAVRRERARCVELLREWADVNRKVARAAEANENHAVMNVNLDEAITLDAAIKLLERDA